MHKLKLHHRLLLRNPILPCSNLLHCCMSATMLVSMEDTRWWKYVKALLKEDTFKAAATKAGFNQSAFSRWSRGATADPAFVVKLARAYGANVLEALVEAEFITEEEAALKHVSPDIDLTKIDGADLAAELDRRIRVLNYLKNLDENPAFEDLKLSDVAPELAATKNHHSNGIVTPIRPVVDDDLPAVADSSPDNPEEDIEFDD